MEFYLFTEQLMYMDNLFYRFVKGNGFITCFFKIKVVSFVIFLLSNSKNNIPDASFLQDPNNELYG